VRQKRTTRAGIAGVGASHLSTAQCSVFPVVLMVVSFAFLTALRHLTFRTSIAGVQIATLILR
jgi:hypothetical protein